MTMLSLLLVTENRILLKSFGFSEQDPEGLVQETGSRNWEAGKRKLKCPEFKNTGSTERSQGGFKHRVDPSRTQ